MCLPKGHTRPPEKIVVLLEYRSGCSGIFLKFQEKSFFSAWFWNKLQKHIKASCGCGPIHGSTPSGPRYVIREKMVNFLERNTSPPLGSQGQRLWLCLNTDPTFCVRLSTGVFLEHQSGFSENFLKFEENPIFLNNFGLNSKKLLNPPHGDLALLGSTPAWPKGCPNQKKQGYF